MAPLLFLTTQFKQGLWIVCCGTAQSVPFPGSELEKSEFRVGKRKQTGRWAHWVVMLEAA